MLQIYCDLFEEENMTAQLLAMLPSRDKHRDKLWFPLGSKIWREGRKWFKVSPPQSNGSQPDQRGVVVRDRI